MVCQCERGGACEAGQDPTETGDVGLAERNRWLRHACSPLLCGPRVAPVLSLVPVPSSSAGAPPVERSSGERPEPWWFRVLPVGARLLSVVPLGSVDDPWGEVRVYWRLAGGGQVRELVARRPGRVSHVGDAGAAVQASFEDDRGVAELGQWWSRLEGGSSAGDPPARRRSDDDDFEPRDEGEGEGGYTPPRMTRTRWASMSETQRRAWLDDQDVRESRRRRERSDERSSEETWRTVRHGIDAVEGYLRREQEMRRYDRETNRRVLVGRERDQGEGEREVSRSRSRSRRSRRRSRR